MSRSKPQPTAVLYARVSSAEQAEGGFSIDAQLSLLRHYASDEGLRIVQEYIDVETAKTSGRLNFGRMVEFLETSDCRTVLVEKTDRLYRNIRDWVTVDDLDVEIHFVKEAQVLSRSSRSSDKFIHGIKVLMAKNYVDNLSEECRKGMAEKAAQGYWPTRAPLGYVNTVGADGKKTIVPDPDRAHLVKQLFEWYATGRFSLNVLKDKVRELGLTHRGLSTLSKSSIYRILTNPVYTGEIHWAGKVHAGTFEPLITCDLFERVQAVTNPPARTRRDFPFTGLIICGHCGCSVSGEIKKGRYIYYRCSHYKQKCPDRYISQARLEEQFSAIVRALSFPKDVLEWVRTALKSSHADELSYHQESLKRLRKEADRIARKLTTLYEDRLDGRIDAAFYDVRAEDFRTQGARVAEEIRRHESADQSYIDTGIRVLELAQRAHELFEKQKPAEKRRLLQFLLSNCTLAGGKLTPTYRRPFDLIVEELGSVVEMGVRVGEVEKCYPFVHSFREYLFDDGRGLVVQLQALEDAA